MPSETPRTIRGSMTRPAWEQIEFAVQVAEAFCEQWGLLPLQMPLTAIPLPCHDHVWRGFA